MGQNKRKNYSKINVIVPLPSLLESQLKSFKEFLQEEVSPEKRKEVGLQEVFKEIFPIEDPQGHYSLEFLSFYLQKPKYTKEECLAQDITYAAALRAILRLVIREEGKPREVVENDVYLGDIPLMTETGSFIINGAERVVVSQLHRSPGVFFDEEFLPGGRRIYSAEIIPYRGSWVKFIIDRDETLSVSIDRRRKFPATLLLRALGYINDSQLLQQFYPTIEVKLKEGVEEKIVGKILAEEVKHPQTQEILGGAGTEITQGMLTNWRVSGINKIKILDIDSVKEPCVISKTIATEGMMKTQEEALSRIYHLLHPGEILPPFEIARAFFQRLFFDKKRYDLKRVGRYQMNLRLKMEEPLTIITLTEKDFIVVIKHLLDLRNGKIEPDDIDHLGNRRILTVGELLANQFSVALSRMARVVRERMVTQDHSQPLTPQELVNSRIITSVINTFFGSSQLSQFLDQPNPLADLRHKRRLSALGPGGLTRERAGFEVRDVHYTHYGRICPIETPEGPNIGLISSLASYARINEMGFIETPYRKVKDRRVLEEIKYLSAQEEDLFTIAQANTPIDETGNFVKENILCRRRGDFPNVSPKEVHYVDVSPVQMVSLSASLIPFLEHNDANRALMGSNMQCQAVPLLKPEAPVVGTGMEEKIAVDSGVMILARREGMVEKLTGDMILVRPTKPDKDEEDFLGENQFDCYSLIRFRRSNQDTCIHQRPLVREGELVKKGQVLADGPATESGELALGVNVLVAFLPWLGYNFEDAIVVSEKMVKGDRFTSIHIETFECVVRETKRGPEEITREIPNVGEEALKNLDENGIIHLGARVEPGDILVGKVSPKGETELTPEMRLLRAIFGERAEDVKDTSLRAPSGMEGIVIDVKVFSRRSQDRLVIQEQKKRMEILKKEADKKIFKIRQERNRRIQEILKGEIAGETIRKGERILMRKGQKFTPEILDSLNFEELELEEEFVEDRAKTKRIIKIMEAAKAAIKEVKLELEMENTKIEGGDGLPPDVLKMIKVFIARKRHLMVGDKLAGRHGNKGVVAKIVPEEDMPYLADGTPVDIVLNPLGVPSRMNVGQILETHLGWAAKILGMKVASPVFDGATLPEIKEEMKKADIPEDGKVVLYDGITGEPFDEEVTVGYMYIMKLSHLVDDKIHARSIGPYSLVTQQPLGGKAHFGGQRFGEMEVWTLEAYGAAHTLQEILTVKSDDVEGRQRVYEAIVKGENLPEPGTPASFNVMVKELQGLCLDVQLEKES
ncbi:MAG: DNA-directed RNA polymerase subunit beta [Candidatus Edwardsbacteria bacterium]